MLVSMLTFKDQGGFAKHIASQEPGNHTSEWVKEKNPAAMNSASASESNDHVAAHSRPTAAAVDTLDKPFKKVRFSTIVEVACGHDQEASLDHRYLMDLKSAGTSCKVKGQTSETGQNTVRDSDQI
jgi:hypothetical protein